MEELISVEAANSRLNKLLVGDFFSNFEVGSAGYTLSLGLADRYIVFFSMSSSLDDPMNQALKQVDLAFLSCVDPEILAHSTVLAATARKPILSATVDETAALTLVFEGNISLTLGTDVDIIDCQWYVSKDRGLPYFHRAEIACLWKSEISIWDDT